MNPFPSKERVAASGGSSFEASAGMRAHKTSEAHVALPIERSFAAGGDFGGSRRMAAIGPDLLQPLVYTVRDTLGAADYLIQKHSFWYGILYLILRGLYSIAAPFIHLGKRIFGSIVQTLWKAVSF